MANLLPSGKQQYFDPATGKFLVGGKLYTYLANTSLATPKATYTNQAGNASNTNPIILDAYGQATVFWSGAYDVVLKDSADNIIGTYYGLSTLTDAADITYDGATISSVLLNNMAYSVNSITNLRGIDKTAYTYAIVMGYYADGDGGGGVYWYDSGDTTTADNGGSVIVATDGGRWKLETFGQPMSVMQFGAKPDGVTDASSAFTDALTALSTNGGIITALGNFKLDDNITVPANIHLKGFNGTATIRNDGEYIPSNYASTIILASGKKITRSNGAAITGFLILSDDVSPAGTHDLPWVDDATAQAAIAAYSGYAIYGAGAYSGKLEDLIIIGFEYGVYDASGLGTDTQMNRVLTDCTNGFYVANREGISANYSLSGMRLKDCGASDFACTGQGFTSTTRAGRGFYIDGLNVLHCSTILDGFITSKHLTGIVTNSYCALINCTSQGTSTGLEINGTDVRVTDGYFKGTNFYGITTKASATYKISGSTLDGGTADLYVQASSGYGTLDNHLLTNGTVSGAAADLLKCTVSSPRKTSAPVAFTPIPRFSGGFVGMTFTTLTGAYWVNGNVVTGAIDFLFSAKGSSTGAFSLGGLPFTSSAVSGSSGFGSFNSYQGFKPDPNQAGVVGYIAPSATEMNVYFGVNDANEGTTNVLDSDMTDTSSGRVTFSYMIDR